MKDKFEPLSQISDAIYERDLSDMRQILSKETQLREKLSLLEKLYCGAAGIEHDIDVKRHALGIDEAWQIWVERNREDLQAQLARILYRKNVAADKLRAAFGRKQITAALMVSDRKEALSKIESSRNGIIEISMLQLALSEEKPYGF